MKTIIEDQDDYIQELESQIVKIHTHMQDMEGQIDNLQEIIEYLIRKNKLTDSDKNEITKEREVIAKYFQIREKIDKSEQLNLFKEIVKDDLTKHQVLG